MNAVLRQRALNYLNKMDVIESQGGEESYALVENNEENRYLLTEAGIPLETALKYGDDETFCILALAFSEGYATYYDGEKLHYYDRAYHDIALKGLKEIHYKMLNKPKEIGHHSEWLSGFGAAIDFLEENY